METIFGLGFIFTFLFESIFSIVVFVVIFKVITTAIKNSKRKESDAFFKSNIVTAQSKYKDVTKTKLEMFKVTDIEQFKKFLYKIFYDFEVAYNNLDYTMMKQLSTEQVFQNYYTGIKLDLEIEKKRIIENIEKKDMIIYSVDSTTNKQIVCTVIEISYIDYTLDKNGYVISGDRNSKKTERFEVIYKKEFGKKNDTRCPNCGATLNNGKCEYCKSNFKNIDFKISSIKKILD